MAELGFRSIDEMVGRVDALDVDDAIDHWKAKGLDLSKMLAPAIGQNAGEPMYCTRDQDHGIDEVLDWTLLEKSKAAVEDGKQVKIDSPIKNTDRAVGAILSHHVVKAHGSAGLPDDTIEINFVGSAGQSLGAFLAGGVTLTVTGDANDYVGKGLSGGRVVVKPPAESTFAAEENVIIGNVALYGATSGEAFFRGVAAERFAVRNSGATTVVEGVGRAVILGKTGRNFAAGMSGGIAYIFDPEERFIANVNLDLVEVDQIKDADDIAELKSLIETHTTLTQSVVGQKILDDWDAQVKLFKKVIPTMYRLALERRAAEADQSQTAATT